MAADDNAVVSEVVHLTSADARRVPWKNGRGVTEELAIWPAGAGFESGAFDWRISKASVTEAGPFSPFPDHERVLVVTGGGDLVLSHGAHAPAARVGRLEPYRFDGGWPTSAALPDGPVRDFNVLARRGRIRADVEVLRGSGAAVAAGAHAFVHVLVGEAVIGAGRDTLRLAALESAWLRGGGSLRVEDGAADRVVLSVRISRG
jgi:environmental stress-induced protein Ves